MTKKTKILLIILAIPIVLIASGVIFLKLYFTSDRLKALILPKVEEVSHRKVSVENISLTLFPHLGVSLTNLKISAPQGAKFDKT